MGNAEIIRRRWRMQDDWSAEGETDEVPPAGVMKRGIV